MSGFIHVIPLSVKELMNSYLSYAHCYFYIIICICSCPNVDSYFYLDTSPFYLRNHYVIELMLS